MADDNRQGLVALLKAYFASGGKRLRQIGVDGGYDDQWLRDWVRLLAVSILKGPLVCPQTPMQHGPDGFKQLMSRSSVPKVV